MVVTTPGISAMRQVEVDTMLQQMGWKPAAGVKLTLLEKKSVLRELLEKNRKPRPRPSAGRPPQPRQGKQ